MEAGFLDELDKRGDQMLSKIDQTLSSLSIMFDEAHRQQLTDSLQSFRKTMDAYSALAQQAQPTLHKLPQIADNLDATLASTRKLSQSLADPKGALMTTLSGAGADLTAATQSMQSAANVLTYETLPQLNGFAREARQAVRGFDHAVTDFNARPQSVLFGPAPGMPGPGESGFAAPAAPASAQP
jgi:phospholipid/cholesterol/gamma-HCH transport system substrate-binding protein